MFFSLGDYNEHRYRRLRGLIAHMGASWFPGKKILELGCGYGDIGSVLWSLGSDVTWAEGRLENVEWMQQHLKIAEPGKILLMDSNLPWDLSQTHGRFDLIVHWGVLYHLNDWRQSLISCAKQCDYLTLETAIADSDDVNFDVQIHEDSQHLDQAVNGIGSRYSAAAVEKTLTDLGFSWQRDDSAAYNSGSHRYDWPVQNTQDIHSKRRIWFCKNSI